MRQASIDDMRKVTEETLNDLHDSKLSLVATIAAARRAIETSRTVMKQAAAVLLPRDVDASEP